MLIYLNVRMVVNEISKAFASDISVVLVTAYNSVSNIFYSIVFSNDLFAFS
ncbi:MAG: hypothetical protein WKG06_32540 [Segetibacter sp.]